MRNEVKKLTNIADVVTRVNTNQTGKFLRVPEPIIMLRSEIASVIGDTFIHISEFIIAKIQGRIKDNVGHPEITDEILVRLPYALNNPIKIHTDIRSERKYIFIASDPLHVIIIETRRMETGLTEINTIYRIDRQEQRRLEKFPTAYCPPSGGTPSIPSYMPRQ
jgi:hypothetical protein